jgi:chromosome segregation ATPase
VYEDLNPAQAAETLAALDAQAAALRTEIDKLQAQADAAQALADAASARIDGAALAQALIAQPAAHRAIAMLTPRLQQVETEAEPLRRALALHTYTTARAHWERDADAGATEIAAEFAPALREFAARCAAHRAHLEERLGELAALHGALGRDRQEADSLINLRPRLSPDHDRTVLLMALHNALKGEN